ncbi:MAG: arginine--tRNA ligase [Spirulina sp. SIO3F2]|nr:arginine--tRNA ligase [Spirulina sp. SIO3F2]
MPSIQAQLNQQFTHAFTAAFGSDLPLPDDPLVVPASNPKFGDYQCNAALPLAKPLKRKPRDIAQTLLDNLQIEQWCEEPEIAGPGFINLRLKTEVLARQLTDRLQDERLGVERVKQPQKVIVDFSSPNIAKEMHVGHLRSTIIGDSIARILEFQGHEVLRLNHVGDWGTQFGMLIAYLREAYPEALTTADALDLGDLVALYKKAKQRFDEDAKFKETAREEVVRLQAGADDSRRAWQLLCDQSRREFQTIYDRLDIQLTERGESFYNPLLPGVLETLEAARIVAEDGGAKCVFLDGFTNKEGNPLPLIVQKSDGGYNYATTDLAALQYRIGKDEGDRIVYVTDSGQSNHFTQVFQVARKAGILPDEVQVVHVPFGLVQGEDGKKLKTRSGETIKLKDLLDEAVDRFYQNLEKRLEEESRTETEEFKQEVATKVGLSAVKYADLSQNRTSNYIFSYDKMLAPQGNTSPYLLYAYARIRSIARKGQSQGTVTPTLAVPETSATEIKPLASQPILLGGVLLQKLGDFGRYVLDASRSVEQLEPVVQQINALRQLEWGAIGKTTAILVISLLFSDAVLRVHAVLHTLPFMPSLMCLVGVFASSRFAWQFLLFASGRQQLTANFEQAKLTVLGDPDATPQLAPSKPAAALPAVSAPELQLTEPEELALAKHILQLDEVLQEVEQDLMPNRLCQYLFELSQKFNKFFEECPVLKSEEPVRSSRLALCELTARTLRLGLGLLGIPVLERM